LGDVLEQSALTSSPVYVFEGEYGCLSDEQRPSRLDAGHLPLCRNSNWGLWSYSQFNNFRTGLEIGIVLNRLQIQLDGFFYVIQGFFRVSPSLMQPGREGTITV
jgi:hypothetical protein